MLQEKFGELSAELAPLFARREPRAHACAYMRGLLADLPRKNCWTVAEHAGQEKKGAATTGVGRQYTGTTGQVSNAAVAV